MRTRLPHLIDTWMLSAVTAVLFTDAFGRTIVPDWGAFADWALWVLIGAILLCQYKVVAHHYIADCDHCPSTDPEGTSAAGRARLWLRALHLLVEPLARIAHRLGSGPAAAGAVLLVAAVAVPMLLLGWLAPDGFAMTFACTYLAAYRMACYRHAQLAQWCPWCRHGGGGGGEGGDASPDSDPEPAPTRKRDHTLAA